MNFLHVSALLALTAITVPIVLHLRRQNRAKPELWAAMRFLRSSLVRRQKGLALEYLLLLACRCLIIFAFVFAMARPHISEFPDTRWMLPSSLAVAAIILLLVAVLWRFSWKVRATACVLSLAGAVTATLLFANSQAGLELLTNAPRDVVLILDCSASTSLPATDREQQQLSVFESLRDEAARMLNDLPGGSTVAVMEAGAVVLPSETALNTNLRAASDQLFALKPHGGSCDLVKAVEKAKGLLTRGSNAEKQILVFSDRQLRMWQSLADHLHNNAATSKSSSPEIQLFTRTSTGNSEGPNPALVELLWDHTTVRLHQSTTFKIRISNGGSAITESCSLNVSINDAVIFRQDGIRLAPDTHQEFQVTHQFESTGPQVVTASISSGGILSADDLLQRVIDVRPPLPILLVHFGNPVNSGNTVSAAESSAFVKLALQPSLVSGNDSSNPNKAELNQTGLNQTGLNQTGLNQTEATGNRRESSLVSLTTIDAVELPGLSSLDEFDVILLCDVPRLPREIADRIAKFVESGGGLFVMAGRSAEPEFYNNWSLDDQEPVLPITFSADMPVNTGNSSDGMRINLATNLHPTVRPLVESGQHDLGDLVVTSYRKSDPRNSSGQGVDNAPAPITGLQLTNGDPLLVEHGLGRGHVLTLLMSPDLAESNLIRRLSFPVLLNLWTQYLSQNQSADLQLAPTEDGILSMAQLSSLGDESIQGLLNQPLNVIWPDGTKHPADFLKADFRNEEDFSTIRVGSLVQPGIHRIVEAVSDELSPTALLPFAVTHSAEESELKFANDRQFDEILQQSGVQEIRDLKHLQQVSNGMPHGREVWDWFLIIVMGFVVLEAAVQGWLRGRRQIAETPI